MPTIARYLAKLVEVHGARHPELARVAAYFDTVIARPRAAYAERGTGAVSVHPRAGDDDGWRPACPQPVRHGRESDSHDGAGAPRSGRRAADHPRIDGGYAAPDDGCTTYAVCMAELGRFERDLHRHVHLENNVLFPKAVALENGYHAS